jgi:undecaprenyl pyrophosphate phosphatase UppP
MTNPLTRTLLIAAAVALAATVPFSIMEVVNRQGYGEDFPFVVFGAIWVIAWVFFAALLLIARSLRKARDSSPSRWAVLRLVAVVLVLTVVAVAAADGWIEWVSDQWPCFMGVRYCD